MESWDKPPRRRHTPCISPVRCAASECSRLPTRRNGRRCRDIGFGTRSIHDPPPKGRHSCPPEADRDEHSSFSPAAHAPRPHWDKPPCTSRSPHGSSPCGNAGPGSGDWPNRWSPDRAPGRGWGTPARSCHSAYTGLESPTRPPPPADGEGVAFPGGSALLRSPKRLPPRPPEACVSTDTSGKTEGSAEGAWPEPSASSRLPLPPGAGTGATPIADPGKLPRDRGERTRCADTVDRAPARLRSPRLRDPARPLSHGLPRQIGRRSELMGPARAERDNRDRRRPRSAQRSSSQVRGTERSGGPSAVRANWPRPGTTPPDTPIGRRLGGAAARPHRRSGPATPGCGMCVWRGLPSSLRRDSGREPQPIGTYRMRQAKAQPPPEAGTGCEPATCL